MLRKIETILACAAAAVAVLAAPNLGQAATAKENFEWYCSQCHGPNGNADGVNVVDELPVGPMNLTKAKEMKKFNAAKITNTLTHGGPINNLDSLMPPWGDRLSKSEIAALVQYVQSLCKEADCPKN